MSEKKKDKQLKSKKRTIKIIVIALGVLLLFDLSPLGGTMKFYAIWINCGREPVAIKGSGYFNDGVSSYYTPSKVGLFPGGGREYFCTAFDAEKHGFSANPKVYEFPVLKKNNALCQKPGDPESETAALFSPCESH